MAKSGKSNQSTVSKTEASKPRIRRTIEERKAVLEAKILALDAKVKYGEEIEKYFKGLDNEKLEKLMRKHNVDVSQFTRFEIQPFKKFVISRLMRIFKQELATGKTFEQIAKQF